jgi:hypothetical protein
MELLAGLEVTAKTVERHAEAIGAAIAGREQAKVNRTVQLELPGILGLGVPVLDIENGWNPSAHRAFRTGRTRGESMGSQPTLVR